MTQVKLKYREKGPDMNPEPVDGVSLRRAAEWFTQGRPTFVTLEPGDATRYDLLIVPHVSPYARMPSWGTTLVVTVIRYVGGHAIEADNFKWPFEGPWALTNIGKNNHWSKEVLAWWLEEFAYVVEHLNDSANTAPPFPCGVLGCTIAAPHEHKEGLRKAFEG